MTSWLHGANYPDFVKFRVIFFWLGNDTYPKKNETVYEVLFQYLSSVHHEYIKVT